MRIRQLLFLTPIILLVVVVIGISSIGSVNLSPGELGILGKRGLKIFGIVVISFLTIGMLVLSLVHKGEKKRVEQKNEAVKCVMRALKSDRIAQADELKKYALEMGYTLKDHDIYSGIYKKKKLISKIPKTKDGSVKTKDYKDILREICKYAG